MTIFKASDNIVRFFVFNANDQLSAICIRKANEMF